MRTFLKMNLSFLVNNITFSRVVFSKHAGVSSSVLNVQLAFTRLTRSFDLCVFTLGKSQKRKILYSLLYSFRYFFLREPKADLSTMFAEWAIGQLDLHNLSIQSRNHERTISLRFLGITLKVIMREVSLYNVYITNQFQTTLVRGMGGGGRNP